MTAFEYDHIDLYLEGDGKAVYDDGLEQFLDPTSVRFFVKDIELDWPPPERITLTSTGIPRAATEDDMPEIVMVRFEMSEISDERMAEVPGIGRGASYRYERGH